MSVILFNFKKDWNHLVVPHLNDPEVLNALDESMYEFSLRHRYKDMPVWERSNGRGPWEYTTSDYWATKILDKVNESPENQELWIKYAPLLESEGLDEDFLFTDPDSDLGKQYWEEFWALERQFSPKPGTLSWYQCLHSGHYYVHFELALAKKVLPEYHWNIFADYGEDTGTGHSGFSAVVGINDEGDVMVFDILHFESMTATEILDEVGFDCSEEAVTELKYFSISTQDGSDIVPDPEFKRVLQLKKKVNVKMFDFKSNWQMVEQHLNNPEVLDALDISMLLVSTIMEADGFPKWDRDEKMYPWEYSQISELYVKHSDMEERKGMRLQEVKDEYARIAQEAGLVFTDLLWGLEGDSAPKVFCDNLRKHYHQAFSDVVHEFSAEKGDYKHYQVFGSSQYMVYFQKVLAEKIFPNFEWFVRQGSGDHKRHGHSTVLGLNLEGDMMIFDLLAFEEWSIDELLERVGGLPYKVMTAEQIFEEVGIDYSEVALRKPEEPCKVIPFRKITS